MAQCGNLGPWPGTAAPRSSLPNCLAQYRQAPLRGLALSPSPVISQLLDSGAKVQGWLGAGTDGLALRGGQILVPLEKGVDPFFVQRLHPSPPVLALPSGFIPPKSGAVHTLARPANQRKSGIRIGVLALCPHLPTSACLVSEPASCTDWLLAECSGNGRRHSNTEGREKTHPWTSPRCVHMTARHSLMLSLYKCHCENCTNKL